MIALWIIFTVLDKIFDRNILCSIDIIFNTLLLKSSLGFKKSYGSSIQTLVCRAQNDVLNATTEPIYKKKEMCIY